MMFPKLFGMLYAAVSYTDQEQERSRSPTRDRTLHIEFWRTMQPLHNFLEASVNLPWDLLIRRTRRCGVAIMYAKVFLVSV